MSSNNDFDIDEVLSRIQQMFFEKLWRRGRCQPTFHAPIEFFFAGLEKKYGGTVLKEQFNDLLTMGFIQRMGGKNSYRITPFGRRACLKIRDRLKLNF